MDFFTWVNPFFVFFISLIGIGLVFFFRPIVTRFQLRNFIGLCFLVLTFNVKNLWSWKQGLVIFPFQFPEDTTLWIWGIYLVSSSGLLLCLSLSRTINVGVFAFLFLCWSFFAYLLLFVNELHLLLLIIFFQKMLLIFLLFKEDFFSKRKIFNTIQRKHFFFQFLIGAVACLICFCVNHTLNIYDLQMVIKKENFLNYIMVFLILFYIFYDLLFFFLREKLIYIKINRKDLIWIFLFAIFLYFECFILFYRLNFGPFLFFTTYRPLVFQGIFFICAAVGIKELLFKPKKGVFPVLFNLVIIYFGILFLGAALDKFVAQRILLFYGGGVIVSFLYLFFLFKENFFYEKISDKFSLSFVNKRFIRAYYLSSCPPSPFFFLNTYVLILLIEDNFFYSSLILFFIQFCLALSLIKHSEFLNNNYEKEI